MFQDYFYENGIAQYMDTKGNTNLEFEVKVLQDVACFTQFYSEDISGGCGYFGKGDKFGKQYEEWIFEISNKYNNGTLDYKHIINGYGGINYNQFLEDFANKKNNPNGYTKEYIKQNMTPEVLKFLFSKNY